MMSYSNVRYANYEAWASSRVQLSIPHDTYSLLMSNGLRRLQIGNHPLCTICGLKRLMRKKYALFTLTKLSFEAGYHYFVLRCFPCVMKEKTPYCYVRCTSYRFVVATEVESGPSLWIGILYMCWLCCSGWLAMTTNLWLIREGNKSVTGWNIPRTSINWTSSSGKTSEEAPKQLLPFFVLWYVPTTLHLNVLLVYT